MVNILFCSTRHSGRRKFRTYYLLLTTYSFRPDSLQQVVRREAREVVAEREAAGRAQLGLERDRAVRPPAEQRVPPREDERPVFAHHVPEEARTVARRELGDARRARPARASVPTGSGHARRRRRSGSWRPRLRTGTPSLPGAGGSSRRTRREAPSSSRRTRPPEGRSRTPRPSRRTRGDSRARRHGPTWTRSK